jgi:hypothetical protein
VRLKKNCVPLEHVFRRHVFIKNIGEVCLKRSPPLLFPACFPKPAPEGLRFPGTPGGVDCQRGDRLFALGTVAGIQSWAHISVMAGCAWLEGGVAGAF